MCVQHKPCTVLQFSYLVCSHINNKSEKYCKSEAKNSFSSVHRTHVWQDNTVRLSTAAAMDGQACGGQRPYPDVLRDDFFTFLNIIPDLLPCFTDGVLRRRSGKY